jgi:hypothetical protein
MGGFDIPRRYPGALGMILPLFGVERSPRHDFTPIWGSKGALGMILPLFGVERSPRHDFTPIWGRKEPSA